MARTPALLVPNTEAGRFYNALPDLAARMAQGVDDAMRRSVSDQSVFESSLDCFQDAKIHLENILWQQLSELTFSDVQGMGPVAVLNILKAKPLLTWDDRFPLEKTYVFAFGKSQFLEMPVQRVDHGLYRFPPTIAYALLSRQVNRAGRLSYISDDDAPTRAIYDPRFGVCFTPEVAYCLIGDPAWQLSSLGLADRGGSPNLIKTPLYAFLDGIAYGYQEYLQRGENWYRLAAAFGVDLSQFYISRTAYQPKSGAAFVPLLPDAAAFPWCTSFTNWPNFLIGKFAQTGRNIQEWADKVQRGQWLQFGFALLAIAGIGSAVEAMGTVGANVQNIAKLTASIDNLPAVDLGVAGDIAAGLASGLKLAATIPDGSILYVDDSPLDAGAFEPIGVSMDEFDISDFDFGLTLDDIGANVVDFDSTIFEDYGLEATDLIVDDFGNVFTVAGEAVALDPETYVKSIYVDELGNYVDYSNTVILSQAEAEAAFQLNELDEDVANALAEKVRSLGGTSLVAQPAGGNRPAHTPAAAAQGEVPFIQVLSQEVLSWFKTITQYSLAKEQLQKTGRYTAPYATSPTGTVYPQIPGVPIRRSDGSTVVNNGNGTQTVIAPNGQMQTLPASVDPRQFSNSQFMGGGQLIAGVSNQTLLIAGVGLVAVALLARRN